MKNVFDIVSAHAIEDVRFIDHDLSSRIARLQSAWEFAQAAALSTTTRFTGEEDPERQERAIRLEAYGALWAFIDRAGQQCLDHAREAVRAGDVARCQALLKAGEEFLDLRHQIDELDLAMRHNQKPGAPEVSPSAMYRAVFGVDPEREEVPA